MSTIKALPSLSPQIRRTIIHQYEAVNHRIAKQYLGREKLFEAPLPEDHEPFDESTVLSEEELLEVVTILTMQCAKNHRELALMRQDMTVKSFLKRRCSRIMSHLMRILCSVKRGC
ncbi:MAG: hypothetical protein GY821_17645 [Gammaproteobacteria bacterium]|nr:hypothetical protein [Gammaproteobacteria bacterium]